MIAIQSLSSRQGVSCHVLYGGQHRHNKDRDGDSLLSCKGMICYYVDNGHKFVFLTRLLFPHQQVAI